MVKITGQLMAKAENPGNSAIIIEIKPAIPADAKTGAAGVQAERASITLPNSIDISSLKRGKKVTITID